MKAESMQLFMIPMTKNYQSVHFATNNGDASHKDGLNIVMVLKCSSLEVPVIWFYL